MRGPPPRFVEVELLASKPIKERGGADRLNKRVDSLRGTHRQVPVINVNTRINAREVTNKQDPSGHEHIDREYRHGVTLGQTIAVGQRVRVDGPPPREEPLKGPIVAVPRTGNALREPKSNKDRSNLTGEQPVEAFGPVDLDAREDLASRLGLMQVQRKVMRDVINSAAATPPTTSGGRTRPCQADEARKRADDQARYEMGSTAIKRLASGAGPAPLSSTASRAVPKMVGIDQVPASTWHRQG